MLAQHCFCLVSLSHTAYRQWEAEQVTGAQPTRATLYRHCFLLPLCGESFWHSGSTQQGPPGSGSPQGLGDGEAQLARRPEAHSALSRKQDRPDETRKTVMHLTLQGSRHSTVPRLAPVCPTCGIIHSLVRLSPHCTARASTERVESHNTALAQLSLLKSARMVRTAPFSPAILVNGMVVGAVRPFLLCFPLLLRLLHRVSLCVSLRVCIDMLHGSRWMVISSIGDSLASSLRCVQRDLRGQATVVFVTIRAFDKAG